MLNSVQNGNRRIFNRSLPTIGAVELRFHLGSWMGLMSIVGLCNFPMAGDQAFDALESKVSLIEHVTRLKIELKTLAEKVAAIPTS